MASAARRSYEYHTRNAGLLLLLMFFAMQQGIAQQKAQFTQYMFNGLVLNPAYAGAEEALSFTLTQRMQWVGVDDAPVTQALSAHSLVKKKNMGLGLSLVNDKIGVHQNLSIMGMYAYHIALKNSSWLSLGIQAGMNNRKSDYASLAGSSFDDPLVATSSISQTSFDVGTGIYFRSPRLQAGISAPGLLPEKSAVNDTMTVHWDRTNYFLFSRYKLAMTANIDLEPGFLLKYFPGTPISVDINLNAIFYDAITFGLSYRKEESIDFLLIGKVTPQFQFGYSYDYPIGEVADYGSGSHELMLNYRFRFEHTKVDSPR
jgi:type IX secretion system PorP/SprF family membrane protein